MSTKIEWTNETWSPIVGCSKVSEGCRNCSRLRTARRLAEMPHTRSLYSAVTTLGSGDDWNGRIGIADDRVWCKPLHWRKPRRIFVCSMGDLFHENVPFETIDRVFAIMALCPQHTFQCLSKRADRMREYFSRDDLAAAILQASEDMVGRIKTTWFLKIGGPSQWPLPNVWLGVTAENQEAADERIPYLLETPAVVRFVSCEPMLEPVDLSYDGLGIMCPECGGTGEITDPEHPMHPDKTLEPPDENWCLACCGDPAPVVVGVDWVICGGESGPGARLMDPDWARLLRDQCRDVGVPFFMKQMSGTTKHERENIPPDLMIRDFPGGGE